MGLNHIFWILILAWINKIAIYVESFCFTFGLQLIAIIVSEEEDVAAFKDYTGDDAAAEPAPESVPEKVMIWCIVNVCEILWIL